MSENIYNKSHKLDITAKQAIDNADKFLFEDKKSDGVYFASAQDGEGSGIYRYRTYCICG